MKIEDMELSIRAENCLLNAGIKTFSQVYKSTDSELLKIKNLGKKTLEEIREQQDRIVLSLDKNLEEEELWKQNQFKFLVNEFIMPLAKMYIHESNECNIIELCKKADRWIRTRSRMLVHIIKE